MFVSDLSTNNINSNLIPLEKDINKILNEIKSFDPKTSHQKILMVFQKISLNPTILIRQNREKDIQNLKNIIKLLKTIDFYKNSPKYFDELKEQLSNIINKRPSSLANKSEKEVVKYKNFNTLTKEILLHFKAGKIKLLNQNQIIKNIGNITKNIDKIILNLPQNEKYTSQKEELSQFVKDIKQVDMQNNIKNSGVLYESKLFHLTYNKTLPNQIVKNDVKGILLSLKNDLDLHQNLQVQAHIDNTLSQINTIQANALLGQNFTSYIPFAWNDLKDGYFSISKLEKEDGFSCKIDLNLYKYGKIDILMLFHKELLSIKMDIQNLKFKDIIQNNLLKLKNSLNKLGFDTTIFFAKKQQNNYGQEKFYNSSLDMDIKV